MNPATIIKEAFTDGVSLTLSATGAVKVTGNQDQVARWLPLIREQKATIIVALQEFAKEKNVDTAPCFAWQIRFAASEPLTVTFSPEATYAEVLACYPDAVAAEPI